MRDLNQLPQAYEEFGAAVVEANEQLQKDPSYEDTRDTAASERAAIEPAVARVTLLAPDPPSGLAIALNGNPVAPERIGSVIAVVPGHVAVDATAPGRRDFHVDLTVREGASAPVTVTLVSSDATVPPPPVNNDAAGTTPSDDHATPERKGGGIRTAGYFVAGAGVLGIGTFLVAHFMGDAKLSSLDSACGQGQCSQPYFDDQSSQGKTLDLVANIGLGVGIAGAVVGAGMIVFGGSHEVPAQTSFVLTPGGLSIRGRF